VAYIVSKDQSIASPQNVTHAIFSCWPLIFFNLIVAFIVGFIVWLLVSFLQ
jgi:capsular polysaccharide biosynthesis protein